MEFLSRILAKAGILVDGAVGFNNNSGALANSISWESSNMIQVNNGTPNAYADLKARLFVSVNGFYAERSGNTVLGLNNTNGGKEWYLASLGNSNADPGSLMFNNETDGLSPVSINNSSLKLKVDTGIRWTTISSTDSVSYTAGISVDAANRLQINTGTDGVYGSLKLNQLIATSLAGSGTRAVVVDSSGLLSTQAIADAITSLTGEVTATGPGAAVATISNAAVIGKVLTGLNLTGGGTISSTDSILQAFGKIQNQISGMVGGVIYQGVWNASTNTPTITSSAGTKGYYYVVNVAGSTNIDGITDWKIGDWIIFNGTSWDKVDNTDAVSSVNGYVGAVSLSTSDILEGTNLYWTNARTISSTLTGYASGAGTITSSDTVLSAIQKLNGNIAVLVTGVSSVNGGTGAVTIAITGTANRITVTGGTGLAPTIDIASTYVGQTSITTLGTITTGVWNGTPIGTAYTSDTLATVTARGATTSTAITVNNELAARNIIFGQVTGADRYVETSTVATSSTGRRGLILGNGINTAFYIYAGGNNTPTLSNFAESERTLWISTVGGGSLENFIFHSAGVGNLMALSVPNNRIFMYLPTTFSSDVVIGGNLILGGGSGGSNRIFWDGAGRFIFRSDFDILTIQGGINDSNKRQIDFNTGNTQSAYIDISGYFWKSSSSPAIPTNDNTLKFATTAYVQSQGYAKTGSTNTFTATNTFNGTTAFNGAVDGYFNGDLYTFRYFIDGSGFIANQIISWDAGGNISLGNRVYALANYALTKAALTTATLSVGNNFTSAGSSLFVKTGSLSASFASGFGVDGSYSGGLSRINLHAIGTQTTGGYASAMSFILDNNGSSRTHMALDSDRVTRLYGTLDAFVPNADIAVGQFHRLAWNGISAFSVYLNSNSAFPFVYYRMANGRLGINVDNPAVPLDVSLQSGANGQVIRMSRSAGAYTWAMGVDGNSFFSVYNNGGTVLFNINPDTGRNNAVGGITYAYGTHAIRTLAYDAASSVTINLATTFPEVALVSGNTWAVFARCNLFSSTGGVQVREFVIGRNTAGTWSTANYGPNSSTVDSLQSVTGSGSSITINMNSGTYLQIELTVMVR